MTQFPNVSFYNYFFVINDILVQFLIYNSRESYFIFLHFLDCILNCHFNVTFSACAMATSSINSVLWAFNSLTKKIHKLRFDFRDTKEQLKSPVNHFTDESSSVVGNIKIVCL